MDWHTIYLTSNGALKGHGTSLPDPFPGGHSSINHGANRQDQDANWNPSTLVWDAVQASREIPMADFLERMTQAERLDFYSSTLAGCATFERAVKGSLTMNHNVDLDEQATADLLQLLVDDSIITAQRKTDILT